MGSNVARPVVQDGRGLGVDELSARELGLENNLKLAEVNTLIDYYKQNDPGNTGLTPEEFKKAAGEYIADGLTIDPTVIFNIFNSGQGDVAGRVTLREFILGYAILCRGCTEGRLKYLFAIYGSVEGDGYLTRDQLISSLKLMQRIVTEVTDHEGIPDEEENDKQIRKVAGELIAASSDTDNMGISYDDFIEKVKEAEVVTLWLENLGSVAGQHMKYIEKKELDVVELRMERQGMLSVDSQTPVSNSPSMEWSKPTLVEESRASDPSSAERKIQIPLPKKHKLVRRDVKSGRDSRGSLNRSQATEEEDWGNVEMYAAKPFVINYDQVQFGKVLGRGACATVYEGVWLHIPVAVKVFNDGHGEAAGIETLATSDEEVRKDVVGDYVEEFWLLLQIRHPNCLLYMGICFEPYVCIVTELYTGGSVANFLHGPNPRKFTPAKALDMLAGVARGMFYLHASSPPILHRDLKASNILINRALTHCVICDFGLSSQFVNEASGLNLSKAGGGGKAMGVGTPYTMAPEVMEGKSHTPAADVYSFGVVMYEMYTGRFPFPKMKPIQLMFSVAEGRRPIFYEEDNVPQTMQVLIQRCWSQKPEARPNFEEILRVLSSAELEDEVARIQNAALDSGEETDDDQQEFVSIDLSKRLLEAVYRGHQDKAARFIDEGAMVNYADYDKRTALHVAAAEGHTNCVRLLLSSGAMLSHDRWGNSPLSDAINYANRTGDSEPARILRAVEGRSHLVKRADVGDNVEKVLNKDQAENLRNQTAINAAAEGDVVTLKRLLDSGLDVNCTDYDRRTPLAVAASEGRFDIVELLIRHRAGVGHRDRWGSTAYHEAERGGFHDIIRLLRQAEAETASSPRRIRAIRSSPAIATRSGNIANSGSSALSVTGRVNTKP